MRILFFFFLGLLVSGCGSSGNEATQAGSAPGPQQLLVEMADDRRYVSVDRVADWIISDDPSLLLVDVRSHDQFDHFSLPGAVNIPLADFLEEGPRSQLDCSRYSVVLFANGAVAAEQAWMLSRRLGCKDVYVMRGGLNEWARKILDPQEPDPSASAEAFETYQFRKAACQYFIGKSQAMDPEPYVQPVIAQPKPSPKKIIVPKKKKAVEEEEEGC